MAPLLSKCLVAKHFGNPIEALKMCVWEIPDPEENEVTVEWLAAPVNPLDLNRIQGAYVIRDQLPFLVGSEGVGRVIKRHEDCYLRVGDLVVNFSINSGTWTQYTTIDESGLVKLDPRMSIEMGATFMVNPPTAWVMLNEYVKLEPGDYIIQNAANSGVGRAVIELCKIYGVKSVNVVRDRDDIDELKADLTSRGATVVWTEPELERYGRKFFTELGFRPRMAFNGVGGKSALGVTAMLAPGGTCVTYGGMSRQAHQFSTSSLVFRECEVRGILIGKWMRDPQNADRVDKCLQDLQNLAIEGKLTPPPMEKVKLDDYIQAMVNSMTGRPKQLFIIKEEETSKI